MDWPHLYLLILILVIWGLEKLFPRFMNKLEENFLVLIIASIMAVSFGQVIARYAFNTGWTGSLEFNTTMFSWLILMGMSYGIKNGTHLGVDIVLNAVPSKIGKALSLFGALATLVYALLLLDSAWLAAMGVDVRGGAIEYWAKMYKINIGVEEMRWPDFIMEWFGVKERVQRWLVLVILPISLALLAFRSLQAFAAILTDKRHMLIAGHEAQDLVDEHKDALKD
ncbi:MAG: hypothetical protein RL143_683 [Pseudomonadota bacterium]